jgi:hypothetical protein
MEGVVVNGANFLASTVDYPWERSICTHIVILFRWLCTRLSTASLPLSCEGKQQPNEYRDSNLHETPSLPRKVAAPGRTHLVVARRPWMNLRSRGFSGPMVSRWDETLRRIPMRLVSGLPRVPTDRSLVGWNLWFGAQEKDCPTQYALDQRCSNPSLYKSN